MAGRELPKLETGVRFPVPAFSSCRLRIVAAISCQLYFREAFSNPSVNIAKTIR